MSDLPKGWANATLGQLGEYINGRAFKPTEWKKEGLPIIRIQNLNDTKKEFNYSNLEHEAKYRVRKGDLLVAWSASLGTFIWDKGDAWLNQHIFRVEPNEQITTKEFLHYAVKEAIAELYKKAHGTGMVHVTKPVFESHEIPLPPLNEQKRIVEKLEKLLGKVEAFQARLDKIPAILKRFRQAVLAAACSGKLTADFRGVKSKFDFPETWNQFDLIQLCDKARGITYGVIKLGDSTENGIPCLRTSDVKPLAIHTDSVKRISKEISDNYSRTILKGNEVLVNVRGTLGGIAVVPKEIAGWNISREVAMLPILSTVDSKFIAFWIASIESQNWLMEKAKGVAYTGINLEDLRLLPVYLPPIEEQKEIVCRVEDLFKFADQIETRYKKARSYTDKLTQSILGKAFRGELVPQDERDEPASVLLERIKAEKSEDQKTKNKTVKKVARMPKQPNLFS